jgi:hypothetical protein
VCIFREQRNKVDFFTHLVDFNNKTAVPQIGTDHGTRNKLLEQGTNYWNKPKNLTMHPSNTVRQYRNKPNHHTPLLLQKLVSLSVWASLFGGLDIGLT